MGCREAASNNTAQRAKSTLATPFRFGDIPFPVAAESMRLFARERYFRASADRRKSSLAPAMVRRLARYTAAGPRPISIYHSAQTLPGGLLGHRKGPLRSGDRARATPDTTNGA